MAHRFFALLFHFHRLVRFSLRGFQAVDQNSWSSDHGADRPYGTGSRRSADTADETMRLCGRPGFHSLDQILSSIGTEFDAWSGMQFNTGIATDKNMLGADCLILGFFFFWYLLQTWQTERSTRRRNELRLIAGFLIGIWWLFQRRTVPHLPYALFVGVLMVVFVGIRSINKNFIGTYMLAALVLLAVAELTFGISGQFFRGSG